MSRLPIRRRYWHCRECTRFFTRSNFPISGAIMMQHISVTKTGLLRILLGKYLQISILFYLRYLTSLMASKSLKPESTRMQMTLSQNFSESDIRFICYMVAGFDATTISVLMNISTDNVRVKRSRIRHRILSNEGPNAALYRVWLV